MSDGTRTLVKAWLGLMALTLAMAVAADVHAPSRLSPWFMATIGIVVVVKARLILGAYLELASRGGMMKGLMAMITLTLVIVVGSFIPH